MGYAEQIREFLSKVLLEDFDGVYDRTGRAVGASGQQIRRWTEGETSPKLDQLGSVLDELGVVCSPFRRSPDIIIRPGKVKRLQSQQLRATTSDEETP